MSFDNRSNNVYITNNVISNDLVQKNEGTKTSGKKKDLLIAILPAIIAGIFTLIEMFYQGYVDRETDRSATNLEEVQEQVEEELTLYITRGNIQDMEIEYSIYELTSTPAIGGYHVIPYPYLCISSMNKIDYIPISGIYTQTQYTADVNGKCVFKRENTLEGLRQYVEMLLLYSQRQVQVGNLVAVQYTNDKKELEVQVYELRDGELLVADESVVIDVLNAYSDEEILKISMHGWPSNKDYIGQQINNYIIF